MQRMAPVMGVLAVLSPAAALATENGTQDFPIGVNTVLPGVEPPPGETQYLNYTNVYDAGSEVGADGKKSAPGFHLNVVANAFRLLHSWDFTLGQFWFSSGVVLPLVNSNLRVSGEAASDTGFGDLDLQTLYVNWQNKSHSVAAFAGLDIYLPTAHYNKNDLVNIGLNETTFMPTGAITWFVSPRLQASIQSSWEVPTENHATHYQSGASMDLDWAVDYNLFKQAPKWFFGLQGYAFQQLTPDRQYGEVYDDGYYGRALAIGPQVRYNIKGGGIILKYQHEFAVENRPSGDKVWLQVAFPVAF